MDLHERVEHLFRRESARLTASLVQVFGVGNLQLVEDVVQEALLEALRHWRYRGVPENPAAWLGQVARRRALDVLRRNARLKSKQGQIATWNQRLGSLPRAEPDEPAFDEQLQLMFACCHPSLPMESRIALTLRTIGGFGVPEIARAFLLEPEAVAQRLVRARRRIRTERIPLSVPQGAQLPPRLDGVLATIYLMFNEGYAAHAGELLVRRELVEEACRLTGLLLRHEMTADPAVHALLALILFGAARLDARTDRDGEVLLLAEQDRRLWDRQLVVRGFHHLRRSAAGDRLTPYHLEAAIAACHARAESFAETDWPEILSLYELLRQVRPSPVTELNRAVALAMVRGWKTGLRALDELAGDPHLQRYYLLPAVRGEVLLRAGNAPAAAEQFRRALRLSCSEPEQALLRMKLARAQGQTGPEQVTPPPRPPRRGSRGKAGCTPARR